MAVIDISALGIATAAVAGAVSFASPCVLPLVPGYLSYVAGGANAAGVTEHRPIGPALCFVLGFTTIFVLLGISAQALGGLLQRYHAEANLVGGPALPTGEGLARDGIDFRDRLVRHRKAAPR